MPTRELLGEMAVLRLFDGRGAVRQFEADPDQGALLLERIRPGTPLRDLATQETAGDERAAVIAAQVMRRLWRPVPPEHPFRTFIGFVTRMAERAPRVVDHDRSFPMKLFERAVALSAEVSASEGEEVILHGDLHHDNILSAEREPWLAIDPWGVVGNPACERGRSC